MSNYINLSSEEVVEIQVFHEASHLSFCVCAKIVHIVGDMVEPQYQKGMKGSFVYYGERPKDTFVIYILNKGMFEFLANLYEKEMSGLHIHQCVNTSGDMICWPQKINSQEDALDVLKKWSGMIGALLISREVKDINGFYKKYKDEGGDWGEHAIKESGVQIGA